MARYMWPSGLECLCATWWRDVVPILSRLKENHSRIYRSRGSRRLGIFEGLAPDSNQYDQVSSCRRLASHGPART